MADDTYGTIERFKEQAGRWAVRMDYDQSLKDLKSTNLDVAPPE